MVNNKHDKKRKIETVEELENIKEEFMQEWRTRDKPRLRHTIRVRKIIREHGNLIKHYMLVNELADRYGFDEKTINKIILRLLDKGVIHEDTFDNEYDVRYFT